MPRPGSVPRKYAPIVSSEQRQSYKNDFNAEYSEYRGLHARIELVTRRFTQLDAELRRLAQGSAEYEVWPLPGPPHCGGVTGYHNPARALSFSVPFVPLQTTRGQILQEYRKIKKVRASAHQSTAAPLTPSTLPHLTRAPPCPWAHSA